MRKKCRELALWSFVIAPAIYVFTYFLFHYLGPCGKFTAVYHAMPVKPLITMLFGIWGVTFQFAGVMSLLIGRVFFPEEDKQKTEHMHS